MLSKSVLTAVIITAIPSFALAQGFSGGELTIDATGFNEGDDPSAVNYSGALEYSINRNISIAGDVSVYDYSLLDDTITNVTIHGIYHLSDQISVGAFIGRDSSDGDGSSFFGLEGGFEAGQIGVEGYFATYDDSDNSTVLGISGNYQFGPSIAAIADLGFGSIGNEDYTRISAGAEYSFAGGPSVYAEFGNISSDSFDSEFIGLGAKIEFGAARGTTFDRRSAFDTLNNPGF